MTLGSKRDPRGRMGRVDPTYRQEQRVCAALPRSIRPRRTPGSGSQPGAKGDITSDQFLFECKSTQAQSIRLEARWLRKIAREARGVGREPAVVLGFEAMPVPVPRDWVLLPQDVFNRLVARD